MNNFQAVEKYGRRPEWLKKKTHPGKMAEAAASLAGVKTVCREAGCPNISECWEKKTAAFMILGSICTRKCRFCAVEKGAPTLPDADEPRSIARAAVRLGIRHAVITGPTRDDLSDGGAAQFAVTAGVLSEAGMKVELLVPDFSGNRVSWSIVAASSADIIGHNMETVKRLYKSIRPGANYSDSLDLVRFIKSLSPDKKTKSGIMLGLGERPEEIIELFNDLVKAGCSFLSIGQYLRPDRGCIPVTEYINPGYFKYLKKKALQAGFRHVESGPYVRSSYMAERYID